MMILDSGFVQQLQVEFSQGVRLAKQSLRLQEEHCLHLPAAQVSVHETTATGHIF